jgi:hypothetical protein
MTTQATELSPAACMVTRPIIILFCFRLDWLGPLAILFALTSFSSVIAIMAGALETKVAGSKPPATSCL